MPISEENLLISFWKEPDRNNQEVTDREVLKGRYFDDGRRVAEILSKDDDVLAVWLSGPFDLTRVQPSSDLHMSVMTAKTSHIFYRHQLPSFSPVNRRLEIAFLPRNYLSTIVERGFASWNDIYDIHKLSEVEILYEKDDCLKSLRRQSGQMMPKQIFIGRELSRLRHQHNQINGRLVNGQYRECLYEARCFLLSCLKIYLVSGSRNTFSKLSHLYSALYQLSEGFPPAIRDKITMTDNITKDKVKERLETTRRFILNLFERKVKCDDVLD